MICSEVQRTLVKSPPELWAEISDPESLARHLGEFGEIRITHVHPEQKVEWEAENGEASGAVLIKPSGWGTKVKLTVTQELAEVTATPMPEADVQDEEIEPEIAAEAEAEPEPHATRPVPAPAEEEIELEADREVLAHGPRPSESEPEPSVEPAMLAEPEAFAESEPATALESPREPRRGFFARLFGKRRQARANELAAPQTAEPPFGESRARPEPEPGPAPRLEDASGDRSIEPETQSQLAEPFSEEQTGFEGTLEERAAFELEPTPLGEAREGPLDAEGAEDPLDADTDDSADAEGSVDIAAEIKAAEETAEEQVTAVLTGVLDRLGAAHHRPFSRA